MAAWIRTTHPDGSISWRAPDADQGARRPVPARRPPQDEPDIINLDEERDILQLDDDEIDLEISD